MSATSDLKMVEKLTANPSLYGPSFADRQKQCLQRFASTLLIQNQTDLIIRLKTLLSTFRTATINPEQVAFPIRSVTLKIVKNYQRIRQFATLSFCNCENTIPKVPNRQISSVFEGL